MTQKERQTGQWDWEDECLEGKWYTSDSMIHMSDHYYIVTSVIRTWCEAEWVSITHGTYTSLSNAPHHSQESQNHKSCFQARLSFLTLSMLCSVRVFSTFYNMTFLLTMWKFCARN